MVAPSFLHFFWLSIMITIFVFALFYLLSFHCPFFSSRMRGSNSPTVKIQIYNEKMKSYSSDSSESTMPFVEHFTYSPGDNCTHLTSSKPEKNKSGLKRIKFITPSENEDDSAQEANSCSDEMHSPRLAVVDPIIYVNSNFSGEDNEQNTKEHQIELKKRTRRESKNESREIPDSKPENTTKKESRSESREIPDSKPKYTTRKVSKNKSKEGPESAPENTTRKEYKGESKERPESEPENTAIKESRSESKEIPESKFEKEPKYLKGKESKNESTKISFLEPKKEHQRESIYENNGAGSSQRDFKTIPAIRRRREASEFPSEERMSTSKNENHQKPEILVVNQHSFSVIPEIVYEEVVEDQASNILNVDNNETLNKQKINELIEKINVIFINIEQGYRDIPDEDFYILEKIYNELLDSTKANNSGGNYHLNIDIQTEDFIDEILTNCRRVHEEAEEVGQLQTYYLENQQLQDTAIVDPKNSLFPMNNSLASNNHSSNSNFTESEGVLFQNPIFTNDDNFKKAEYRPIPKPRNLISNILNPECNTLNNEVKENQPFYLHPRKDSKLNNVNDLNLNHKIDKHAENVNSLQEIHSDSQNESFDEDSLETERTIPISQESCKVTPCSKEFVEELKLFNTFSSYPKNNNVSNQGNSLNNGAILDSNIIENPIAREGAFSDNVSVQNPIVRRKAISDSVSKQISKVKEGVIPESVSVQNPIVKEGVISDSVSEQEHNKSQDPNTVKKENKPSEIALEKDNSNLQAQHLSFCDPELFSGLSDDVLLLFSPVKCIDFRFNEEITENRRNVVFFVGKNIKKSMNKGLKPFMDELQADIRKNGQSNLKKSTEDFNRKIKLHLLSALPSFSLDSCFFYNTPEYEEILYIAEPSSALSEDTSSNRCAQIQTILMPIKMDIEKTQNDSNNKNQDFTGQVFSNKIESLLSTINKMSISDEEKADLAKIGSEVTDHNYLDIIKQIEQRVISAREFKQSLDPVRIRSKTMKCYKKRPFLRKIIKNLSKTHIKDLSGSKFIIFNIRELYNPELENVSQNVQDFTLILISSMNPYTLLFNENNSMINNIANNSDTNSDNKLKNTILFYNQIFYPQRNNIYSYPLLILKCDEINMDFTEDMENLKNNLQNGIICSDNLKNDLLKTYKEFNPEDKKILISFITAIIEIEEKRISYSQ